MWYAASVRHVERSLVAGVAAAAIAAWGAARTVGADELAFEIGEGRVTLVASGVPLREVLGEWARAGGTRFVGMEPIGASPVSLHLEGVAEREALRLLLRPAAGYLAAPRASGIPGASIYGRVKIRAARRAPQPAASGSSGRAAARRAFPPAPVREAPPLSAADQRARLQRLLRPLGAVEAVAEPAEDTPDGRAVYAPTTPRPGMIVESAAGDPP